MSPCCAGANDLAVPFLRNVDNHDTDAPGEYQFNTILSSFASTLDILVTAPPGPSPTAGNRDAHYHYHYNDRRRIYYQNINSNNSQSTTYSNSFNDNSTKVYKGQRYVGDVNSDSVTSSNGFPFLIISF